MAAGNGIAELGAYIERRADYKRKLTLERVDSVAPDGRVMIRGNRLPVAGRVHLRAGMTVPVAWRDGKMEVVLYGTSRRTGVSGPTVAEVPVAVAEELMRADSGELFFRDQLNFVPVIFAQAAEDAGIETVEEILWGVGDLSFVILAGTGPSPNSHSIIAVCRINRPKAREHFPKVERVRLTLVQAYNMSTLSDSFGTITVTHNATMPATVGTMLIKYENQAVVPDLGPGNVTIRSAISAKYVAPNGDLIVVLGADAVGDATGFDGVTFALGSKLVNVTKGGKVLANHMVGEFERGVFSNETPAEAPVCTLLATIDVSVSTGVPVSSSGHIEAVLSLKQGDPAKDGTFNNYVLSTPAWTRNGEVFLDGLPGVSIFCGVPQADLDLMVVGEFEQKLDRLPGGQGPAIRRALVQGNRVGLIWGLAAPANLFASQIKIADLTKEIVSVVQGSALDVFERRPGARKLFMGRDNLAYSARDVLPPFTRQFFWAGHSQGGAWAINLNTPRKRGELQGKRAAPKSASQKQTVLDGGGDMQVFQEGTV